MATAEDNRRRFTAMYIEAYKGDFRLLREIISDEAMCRNPIQPAGGVAALEAILQEQIDGFEDLRFELRSAFASEDGFGIAYAISGRHVAPVFGLAPSGKPFTVTGVSIHEIIGGRSIGVYSSANFIEVLGALAREDAAIDQF